MGATRPEPRRVSDLEVCRIKIPYWERELEHAKAKGDEAMIEKARLMLTDYRQIERHVRSRFRISSPTDTDQPGLF